MSIVAVENTPARGARNGLRVRPYRYQGSGTDTLTPEIDAMPLELFRSKKSRNRSASPRDPKPCGTPAAYRRHLRYEGAPVTCPACLEGERIRNAERRGMTE